MRDRRRAPSRTLRLGNRPPPDEPFVWFTQDMLASEAWRAMPLAARQVVERVVLEHMAHGGTQNGELQVTYDDFAKYGLSSRRATAQAIRIAAALGFLEVTLKGRRSYGGARLASRYGLTWLPRCDRTPASNQWRCVSSPEAAKAMARGLALRGRPEVPSETRHEKAAAA